jgi:microcystin-dependent protein
MAYFFDSRISVQQGGAVNSTDTRVVSGQTVYDAILDKVYPIGSVYLSVNNVSPQSFLGGTWVSIGEGKTLVGVNPNDTDYNASEMTGGSKTKTLAVENIPSHNHTASSSTTTTGTFASHSHTISHTHTRGTMDITGSFGRGNASSEGGFNGADGAFGHSGTGSKWMGNGSSSSTNLKVDFKASRSWSGSTSGPSSGSSGNASGNISATSTTTTTIGNTGSGTAFDIRNPYLTVYMWKRTA